MSEIPPAWPGGASESARLIREHDWAATPLGPVEGWPERLRALVDTVLNVPQAMWIGWGPELVQIYNDAYRALLDPERHRAAFGRRASETWADTWPSVGPQLEGILAGGPGIFQADHPEVYRHSGEIRELYYTYSFSPVPDGAAPQGVGGVLCVAQETTPAVLLRRAEAALRETEERQSFLLRLSDALRPLADPMMVQSEACRLLAERLDVDRAYYVEIDEAAGLARVERDHVRNAVSSLAGEHPIAAFAWSLELLRHDRCAISDTRSSPLVPDTDRPACAALGIIACMGAPLLKDGRLVGALCVTDAEPRTWTELELGLLHEVAERLWAAVERARADRHLRASEERFRAIVETATDYAIFTTDPEGRIEAWPKGAQAVFGWTVEEAVGRPVDMTFTPEDRQKGEPDIERLAARASGLAPDVRWHLRKDGSRVFIDGVTRPLTRPDGVPQGFVKVGQDVTERRATEEALRESEARFRQFGEASGDVLWIRDAETLEFEYVSPAVEEVYGVRAEDLRGGNPVRRWAELILPEDRALALDHLRRVREGEHVLHAFRITRSDGQVRWIRDTGFPLLDEDGNVRRLGGIGHDATEEVELQDRLRVLVAELQHRSRNLVTVVRGVTERTLATSATLEDFRPRFRSRLEALGRVNALLSRLEEGDRITFDQLLLAELQAHGVVDMAGHGEQARLEGPRGIRLRSATVQTFALALHELATNALKHGALSRPDGRLEVTWRLLPARALGRSHERRLRVEWRETGGPAAVRQDQLDSEGIDGTPVAPRQGYGRELIERALPYQLRAETSYELTPEGVRCTITVPVSSALDVAFSAHGGAEA